MPEVIRNFSPPLAATQADRSEEDSRELDEWEATKWLLGILVIQIVCQLGLLVEALGPLRIGFRTLSFGASLIALTFVRGTPVRHPATALALIVIVIVGFGIAHPQTNSILAAVAQVVLYIAILSPIFWVLRLKPTHTVFARFITLLFLFHITSSFFGVLQAYYPGRFQPAISSIVTESGHGASALEIVLADGTRTLRPMGLTDIPGGAAMSGLFSVIFGIGYYAASHYWWQRFAGIFGVAIGLFSIYLSQVRSIFLMACLALIGFVFFLFQIGRSGVGMRLALVVPALLVGSFLWAVNVGGESMVDRYYSLIKESPSEVYYQNRGKFLESTFETEIPKYPLGAGLGRWGMMYNYFGDKSPWAPKSLWAEIQWTAWTYDGGIPLLIAYPLAILATVVVAYRIASEFSHTPFGIWATLILAYDLAAFALSFNYPLFIGQTGIEFWMLNSILVATAAGMDSEAMEES